jgi:hypothetical protein
MTRGHESRRIDWCLGVGILLLGVALLVGALVVPSGATLGMTHGYGTATAQELPAGATDYAVAFTETGLVNGTSWSMSVNGNPQSSTTDTITFSEPNGSYLFTVTPVTGYSTSDPELNVTVAGAPSSFPVEYVSNTPPTQSCPSFFWTGANNTLFGNCIGSFQADYRSYNATTGATTDNSTFAVGPFAEITPSGSVVALAMPGFDGSGWVTTTSTPTEINVTDRIVGKVTNAIGVNNTNGNPNGQTPQWIPADLPGSGGSTTWGQGREVLGNTTIDIVFHFQNGTANGTSRVKFDVAIYGWPWVSSSDQLGLAIQSGAFALPGGSHFVYTAANDTIAQVWDSSGSTITSLAFGPSANASVVDATSPLQVTDQVGLFPSGNEPTMAGALLTFSGTGGYSGLTYDPWVEFGPHAAIPAPPVGVGGPAGFPLLPVLVGLGGVLAVGLLLGVYAQRARRRPIEDGLRPAA